MVQIVLAVLSPSILSIEPFGAQIAPFTERSLRSSMRSLAVCIDRAVKTVQHLMTSFYTVECAWTDLVNQYC
jgi:hypothetical protein